ncbi:MAG: putative polyketide synthase [Solimicrobium sp.]|nr:putative polyketide synthase [Solimicrobium sp.]
MNEPIENAIAIIGMSCKLPRAETPEQFWQALANGVEAVTFFSDDELLARGISAKQLADPNYVKAAVQLPGRKLFDASFFGISPREASFMDPQQRLLLEGAYRALEHGGYAPEQNQLETGVFVGADPSSYFLQNILPNSQVISSTDQLQLIYTNSSIATQISYHLNLKGPSLEVHTACSTSLVAIHLACRSLLMYECDMALAGGASVQAAEPAGYVYRPDSILSPDGHCRAFDESAAGTVPGQGVALVLLKRYEDAVKDGDTIYSLIRGSAINNDGASKVGYTAPGVDGQIAVLKRALAMAALRPEQISYIECHGTGTSLGDPIELTALAEVYGQQPGAHTPCYLGSLKTNFGHLNSAAGVAGLIKTVLALRHRQIPPSLNFTRLTTKINLNASRLAINTTLRNWDCEAEPLRAAVSSFGIGGTNAHLLLEEFKMARTAIKVPTKVVPTVPLQQARLLTLSAKTPVALEQKRRDFAEFLQSCSEHEFDDACYTANIGRSAFMYRYAFVAGDRKASLQQLLSPIDMPTMVMSNPGVVFVLNGTGESLFDLGRSSYQTLPYFRQTLTDEAGGTLVAILLGNILMNTEDRQVLAFAILYSLASCWIYWGVRPVLMVGDEIGEYAAACLSGVLGFDHAVRLIRSTSQLHAQTITGTGEPTFFADASESAIFSAPRLPYTSSLTGLIVDPLALSQPEYWHQPRRQNVFISAVSEAARKPEWQLLCVAGPLETVLPTDQQSRCIGVTLNNSDQSYILSLAAQLWQSGVGLDWKAFYAEPRQRIPIPTYPFDSQPHWVDIPVAPQAVISQISTSAVSDSIANDPFHNAVQMQPGLVNGYVAPQTEVEHEIAGIWSQLLGIEKIGVTDNFFDLGGHSLLATQINARINARFDIPLTLENFFDMPTIKGTVELLLRKQLAEQQDNAV